jgi:ATP-dependent protease ClpP protease subunit
MAGSAAAIITFAGDTIRMQENAQLFIHRAWSIAIGNVDDFMDSAEFLSKLDDAMALTISKRSQVDIDAVKDFMKGKVDGTTFSAEEAKDIGFVDEIIPVAEKETDKKEAENLKRKQTFLLADAQAKLKTMEFDNQ